MKSETKREKRSRPQETRTSKSFPKDFAGQTDKIMVRCFGSESKTPDSTGNWEAGISNGAKQMKITNLEVTSKVSSGKAFGGENKADRTRRMKGFWSEAQNSLIHPVGNLLAHVEQGKTLAQWLLDGERIELPAVTINGQTLPLENGFALTLATLGQWGCPACKSAHGSGVYPSREQRADLLATNRFYYNPVTKRVFVLSNECWGTYVKALGFAKNFRVPELASKPSTKKPVAAPAPAESK